MSQTLQSAAADGAAISYDIRGTGPDVVLVHGITESRRLWDPLVAPLAHDHRVVTVDLRGHGESERRPPYDAFTMANDLQCVLDDARVEQPLLIGHSLGGIVVSLHAAMQAPRGVVNIDQPLALAGFKAVLGSIEPMLRDEATFAGVMDAVLDSFFGPLPQAERDRVTSHRHPEQDVVLGVWNAVLTTEADELDATVRSASGAILVPYLSLHGDDPGAQYVQWLTEALPHAEYELWPDHGHYPHLLAPERFLQRVRDFEASL